MHQMDIRKIEFTTLEVDDFVKYIGGIFTLKTYLKKVPFEIIGIRENFSTINWTLG